jgi:hypothetical protein
MLLYINLGWKLKPCHELFYLITVPRERNIPKDHAIKINRDYELTIALIRNNYSAILYTGEVARGIPAKSLYNLSDLFTNYIELRSRIGI